MSPSAPQLRSIKNSKSPLALRRTSTVTNSTASSPSSTLLSPTTKRSPQDAASATRPTKVLTEERQKLILEILRTERSYVDGLLILKHLYYEPLNAPFAHKSVSDIFSNFAQILHVNTLLLTHLEDRICGTTLSTGWTGDDEENELGRGDDGDIEGDRARLYERQVVVDVKTQGGETEHLVVLDEDWCIGDIFVEIAPFLKMYSSYVSTYADALAHINECMNRSDRFAEFVKSTNRRPECKNLDFQAYLMMPVQRIPRYRMLLESLLRHTPPHHPDHQQLKRAYEAIEQTATIVNEKIRQHEMFQEMFDIQRRLSGLNEPLIQPSRVLLKKGPVNKICRRNVQLRILFLFSDCLIWTSPSLNPIEDTLMFHRKVKLENCTVIGAEDPDPAKFAFQIMSSEKSSQVYVDTLKEKEDWINAIRSATQEYLSAKRTLKPSTTPMQSISAGTSSIIAAGIRRYDSIINGGAGNGNGGTAGGLARSQTIPTENVRDGARNATNGLGQRERRNTYFQPARVVENYNAPVWVPDQSASRCMICNQEFHALFRRKHHCRACGKVICHSCSTKTILIKSGNLEKVSRACDDCIAMLPEDTYEVDNAAQIAEEKAIAAAAAASLPSPQSPTSMSSFSDDANDQKNSPQSLDAALARDDDSSTNLGASGVVRGIVKGLQRMKSRSGQIAGQQMENTQQTTDSTSPESIKASKRRSGTAEFISEVKECALCREEFTFFKRKNVCQKCRRVVCSNCLTKKQLDQYIDPMCYASQDEDKASSTSKPSLATSDSETPLELTSSPPSSPTSTPMTGRSQSFGSLGSNAGSSSGYSWQGMRSGHVDSGVGIFEKLCDPCYLGLSADQVTVFEDGGGWQYTQVSTLGKHQSQEVAAALVRAMNGGDDGTDNVVDDDDDQQQREIQERLATLDIATTGAVPLV
ncbi:hypothetical protein BGW41_005733 [Actinomortierella wolfii]|nr:hypothetical protein BGW41_005733 [Actinomortierella wolfii]